VSTCDLLDHGQPEAGALIPARDHWQEQSVAQRVGHAFAVIIDVDPNGVACGGVDPGGVMFDPAAQGQIQCPRLNAVSEEIEKELMKPALVGVLVRNAGVEMPLHSESAAAFCLDQFQRVVKDAVRIDAPQARRAIFGDVVDEGKDAIDLALDHPGMAFERGRIIALFNQLRGSSNTSERITQLMRQAACEERHRLLPISPLSTFTQANSLGDRVQLKPASVVIDAYEQIQHGPVGKNMGLGNAQGTFVALGTLSQTIERCAGVF